jgi:hypothetical protein
MSKLEKFGLFLMLLGLAVFRDASLRGLDLLLVLVGFGLLLSGGEHGK